MKNIEKSKVYQFLILKFGCFKTQDFIYLYLRNLRSVKNKTELYPFQL